MKAYVTLVFCLSCYNVFAQKNLQDKPVMIEDRTQYDYPVCTIREDPQTGKSGVVINRSGEMMIPYAYDALKECYLGNEAYCFAAKKNGYWGCIDVHQKILLPFAYDSINYDGQKFFPAAKKGKWGTVNMDGTVKIPFIYDGVERLGLEEKVYLVTKDKLYGCVAADGKVLLAPAYTTLDHLSNSANKSTPWYVLTDIKSKKTLWNKSTQLLAFPAKYDSIADVSAHRVIVISAGKYGVVTTNGNVVLPCKYDYLKFLSVIDDEQPLLMKAGDKYGLAGSATLAAQFNDLQSISAGFYKVHSVGKYKIIDCTGKALTKEEFDHIGVFVNGMVPVFKDDKMAYVDVKGQVGKYQPCACSGYTELDSLFRDMARVMNTKDDSLLMQFCRRVTPESYTLAFMKSIDLNHRDFIHDIEHKAYTMESITDNWFLRLQDMRKQWDRKGMVGELQYKGLSPDYTYLRDESHAVETFTKTVIFQMGEITIVFKPSDLTRMDGRWKAFKLPSRM